MRQLLSSMIFLGLAWSAPASATTGLEWSWDEGESRRYIIRGEIVTPTVILFQADNNIDVRVSEIHVGMNTVCTAAEAGKRTVEVHCTIDDIAIAAAAVQSDADKKLGQVLDEMDTKFTADGAYVQLVVTRDGRVRNVDLEGVSKRNARIEAMHEVMRQIMARMFTTFDLQFPKKGDDKGKGSWNQSQTTLTELMSSAGSMGSTQITHTISRDEDNTVVIDSQGVGTMGSGEMIVVGGVERPRDMYEMQVMSSATFDTEKGTITHREQFVRGEPTASSVSQEYGGGVFYQQALVLDLVPEGAEVPSMGENTELTAKSNPTTLQQDEKQ